MTNLFTVLIAIAKIGAIYAQQRRDRQAFQAAVTLLIMIVIIRNEEGKKRSFNNKYLRKDEF